MAALRCGTCDLNYPAELDSKACGVCGEQLVLSDELEPSPDWWPRAVLGIAPAVELDVLAAFLDQLEEDEESIYPHRYDAHAPIYRDSGGRLWVTHQDLIYNGYPRPDDFMVVWLNNAFFELQGFLKSAQAWWIEKIDVERAFDDLPVVAEA